MKNLTLLINHLIETSKVLIETLNTLDEDKKNEERQHNAHIAYTARWHDALVGLTDEGPTWAAVEVHGQKVSSARERLLAAEHNTDHASSCWHDALKAYCCEVGGKALDFLIQYEAAEDDPLGRKQYPCGLRLEGTEIVILTADPKLKLVVCSKWIDLHEISKIKVNTALMELGLWELSVSKQWSSAEIYLQLEEALLKLQIEEVQSGQDYSYVINQVIHAKWCLVKL